MAGTRPNDADRLERGPVRVRNALQFSLNIPAVKAMAINGPTTSSPRPRSSGCEFQGERTAELALALGVQEVRPVDLVTAYGTLANGGKAIGHTTILAIKDTEGKDVVDPYVPPAGKQVVSPQAAYIVTDILAGNTNRNINPFWGKFAITGPDGRRPATLKTGTNNDAKDLNAYGYIAPPTEDGREPTAPTPWRSASGTATPTTASSRRASDPLFSIDVSTYVWQGFLNEATAKWPETNFARRPTASSGHKIDPWTGMLASSDDRRSTNGSSSATEPKAALGRGQRAASTSSSPSTSRRSFDGWMKADRDWLRRAERGPGVAGGPDRTRTAYFYNSGFHPYGASWGALVGGKCGEPSPSPTCFPIPTPDPSGVVPSFVVPTPGGLGGSGTPLPAREPRSAIAVAWSRRRADRGAATDRGTDTAEPTPEPTPEPTRTRRRPPR